MHVYFVGVGGTGIGPLASIAKQAGFEVSGSDKQPSDYLNYLISKGLENLAVAEDDSHIQSVHIKQKIDWVVYSSAVPKENPEHPILKFADQHGIKATKRDEFLSYVLQEKQLKLIAIAGTHGKTTTTAMVVWLFKQLGLPVSYSVGAKLSFGGMGEYDPTSKYFIYECDEYDRNFLTFHPTISLISGLAWDHPDVYPTKKAYDEAFQQFVDQSETVIAWESDIKSAGLVGARIIQLAELPPGLASITLTGEVNRRDARLAMQSLAEITDEDLDKLAHVINDFPGVSRRFEKIAPHIFSDYAHTPEKIRGALQLAHEVGGDNVIVVYEGLHNTRQHFIKDELAALFKNVKKIYVVPSYRAREDESLEDLTPEKLVSLLNKGEKAEAAQLNDELKQTIKNHADGGDTVLCLSAGGGGSLDEWLRKGMTT